MNLATVEIKAFVPARDFALSTQFYRAIGFTLAWSSDDLAYFHSGHCSFLLQRFHVREHAENFVMHLLVENVDHWHARVTAAWEERFGAPPPAPVDQPWGIRDFPLVDPSGVLWRIGQNLDTSRAGP